MKTITLAWILLSGTVLFANVTREGDGEKLLRQRTEQLSARLVLAEWQNTFAADAFPEGEADMHREMLRDVAANRSPAAARNNALIQWRKSLRSAYRREAGKRLAPFAASLTEAEKEKLCRGNGAFFQQRELALFEAAFRRVRLDVTTSQRVRLFREIYPSPEELETMDDAQLGAVLEARFQKGLTEPLFDENLDLLRKNLIPSAIAEGRKQQALQQQLVRETTIPGTIWDAAPAEAFLTEAVQKEIALRIPDPARRHPLFTQTKQAISKRAKDLPAERVAARFSPEFPEEKYDRMLRDNPAAHLTIAQSLDTLTAAWSDQWIADAIRLAEPPEPWRSSLPQDVYLRRATELHLRKFADKMAPVRNAFAQNQLERLWPELAADRWIPDAAAVETFAAGDRKELPPALPRLQGQDLLVETVALSELQIRRALDREVLRLADQRTATGAVYDAVLAQMENRQEENLKKENSWISRLFRLGRSVNVQLEEVEEYYRTEVENRSSKPLFPSVEEEIRVRSRAILAQILTPDPKRKKTEKEPEPPKKELALELILSGEEGAFALRMEGWNLPCSNVAEASRAASEEIKKRAGAMPEGGAVKLKITVTGNRIYYHSVAELREALKLALPDCTVEDSLPEAKQ